MNNAKSKAKDKTIECKHSTIQGGSVDRCTNCNKTVTQIIKDYKIALSTQAREKDKECQDKINKIFEDIDNLYPNDFGDYMCCRYCVEGEKNSYGKYECDKMTELKKKWVKD